MNIEKAQKIGREILEKACDDALKVFGERPHVEERNGELVIVWSDGQVTNSLLITEIKNLPEKAQGKKGEGVEEKLKVGSIIKIRGLPYEIYTFGYQIDNEGNVIENSLYCRAKNNTTGEGWLPTTRGDEHPTKEDK